MNLKTILVLFLLGVLFGVGDLVYGVATERIGPDTDHPTVSQPDWPKGIVVLAIHTGETKELDVGRWLSKQGLSPTLGTIEGDPYDTLLAWGARGIPWLVLTDEKHIITKAGFNMNDVRYSNKTSSMSP